PAHPVHRRQIAEGLHEADRLRGEGRRARGDGGALGDEADRRLRPDRRPGRVLNAFSGMVEGFQARAKRVNKLLAAPTTTFLVVCGPQGEPIDEAVYFHRKLVEAK